MSWGILFRREIHLTYSRIQDIHLVSNVVERWLGLGRIKIQTASASAKAEMTIEGFREFRQLRDFLYSRMRGARDPARHETQLTTPDAPTDELTGEGTDELTDELTATLYAVAEEIGKLRQELAEQRASTGHTADV